MADAAVGIVGAGITGLALTHHLADRNISSVTLEADEQVGGVIRSAERDGRIVECGPQRLRKTPEITSLIEAVDLDGAVVRADPSLPLFVYRADRLREAPLDAKTLLGTDLLSWRGKLRLLAEPLTREGRPDETAAELFTRKFGHEAYRHFIGPLWGGIYGSDPARMPAKYALDSLLEREAAAGSMLSAFRQRVGRGDDIPPVSFESGLQALPEALAATHADRVRLDTPVTTIHRGDQNWVVETQETAYTVEDVVLTTPADVTASLLEPVVPAAGDLDELNYNPLALVWIDAETGRDGFGYQVGFDEDLHTLGCSWNDSLFDRENLYTVFLGGMHEPEIVEWSEDRLGRIAAREFESVMDSAASVIGVHRLRRGFPAWDASWAALEGLSLPSGLHLATNYTGRMGVPSRVREAHDLADRLAG